jgi:Flp pilus assembly protein TadD
VAIRLKKDDPHAHNNLGGALHEKGQLDQAIAEYREAIRLKKDFAIAHSNLGSALREKGRLDEAIAEFREAIRLKKDYPEAHGHLGAALAKRGQLDEAIAECREAIRLKKDVPETHNNLGHALKEKGQLDEAIAECREAIRLKKDLPKPHYNLGIALRRKGQLDEAIAEYREAIRLKKDYPEAHNNLGCALREKGRLDEAIAEYREAIRLEKDCAEAHYNLGLVLQRQGRFADALSELKCGHELGSKNPRWPYPSAQWVRTAEQLVAMQNKLPQLLKGEAQPADAAERLALAHLCQEQKRFAAATRFYADAFAAQAGLVDDLKEQLRYDAACAAALAGCGQGQDAPASDGRERGRLRRQALDWLRADLSAYRRLLDKEPDQARPTVCLRMQLWQQDSDLAGVRGDALAKLPEAERPPWQKLWAEVAALRQRAAKAPEPAKPGGP